MQVKSVIRKHPRLHKRIVDENDELYYLRGNISHYKKLRRTFMFYILKSTYLYCSRLFLIIFFSSITLQGMATGKFSSGKNHIYSTF